jgi:hypothetical protein
MIFVHGAWFLQLNISKMYSSKSVFAAARIFLGSLDYMIIFNIKHKINIQLSVYERCKENNSSAYYTVHVNVFSERV